MREDPNAATREQEFARLNLEIRRLHVISNRQCKNTNQTAARNAQPSSNVVTWFHALEMVLKNPVGTLTERCALAGLILRVETNAGSTPPFGATVHAFERPPSAKATAAATANISPSSAGYPPPTRPLGHVPAEFRTKRAARRAAALLAHRALGDHRITVAHVAQEQAADEGPLQKEAVEDAQPLDPDGRSPINKLDTLCRRSGQELAKYVTKMLYNSAGLAIHHTELTLAGSVYHASHPKLQISRCLAARRVLDTISNFSSTDSATREMECLGQTITDEKSVTGLIGSRGQAAKIYAVSNSAMLPSSSLSSLLKEQNLHTIKQQQHQQQQQPHQHREVKQNQLRQQQQLQNQIFLQQQPQQPQQQQKQISLQKQHHQSKANTTHMYYIREMYCLAEAAGVELQWLVGQTPDCHGNAVMYQCKFSVFEQNSSNKCPMEVIQASVAKENMLDAFLCGVHATSHRLRLMQQ